MAITCHYVRAYLLASGRPCANPGLRDLTRDEIEEPRSEYLLNDDGE